MPGRSKIAGAMLAIAGTSLYLADLMVPAVVLIAVGAVFTMFGSVDA